MPGTVSKSAADRAGATLAKASDPESADLAPAAASVDAWRAMHAEPLRWMTNSVQGRLSQVVRHVVVGQRLKRKHQIIAKLRRETIRLAQMQDIGGCRAILDGPADVTAAADRIRNRYYPHYELRPESDYREEGRTETGYRALHLIALREGRLIEIQLRTLRQHAWAEAVERAANRSGFDLKSGQGPPEVLEFFRLASDSFRGLELGRNPSVAHKSHLRQLYKDVLGCLRPIETEGRRPPAKIVQRAASAGLNQWLIVYDWRAARFVGWSDLGGDLSEAMQRYASFERRFPYRDGYEVVLVGADSLTTVQRTHSHYFGRDPNDLDPQGVFTEVIG